MAETVAVGNNYKVILDFPEGMNSHELNEIVRKFTEALKDKENRVMAIVGARSVHVIAGGGFSISEEVGDIKLSCSAGTLAELRHLYFLYHGRPMAGDQPAVLMFPSRDAEREAMEMIEAVMKKHSRGRIVTVADGVPDSVSPPTEVIG